MAVGFAVNPAGTVQVQNRLSSLLCCIGLVIYSACQQNRSLWTLLVQFQRMVISKLLQVCPLDEDLCRTVARATAIATLHTGGCHARLLYEIISLPTAFCCPTQYTYFALGECVCCVSCTSLTPSAFSDVVFNDSYLTVHRHEAWHAQS